MNIPVGKIIVGLLVVMAIVLGIGLFQGGQGTTPSPPTPSPKATPAPSVEPAPEPTPPATFEPIVITGSGGKTSPPFTITTDEWIIDWSYVPSSKRPELVVFGFCIYPRRKTAGSVASVSFAEEDGSTYSYAGAGEYYIKVVAANIKSWEVVISPP